MARKHKDSMDHAGNTTANAEETSASGSKAGEMELLYIWINQDETGFVREQGFNFSPNYRFEMKKTEDGQKYELSCTETPENYNVWKQKPIVNLTAVVGENGSGKTALLRFLAYASAMEYIEDYYSDADLEELLALSTMIRVYRHGNRVYILDNFCDNRLINKTKYPLCRISPWNLNKKQEQLYNQSRVYITNALSISKSNFANRWRPEPVIFSPTMNNLRSEFFFWKTSGTRLAEDLPHVFNSMQRAIIRNKTHKEFQDFASVSYYHHLHLDNLTFTPLMAHGKSLIAKVESFEELRGIIGIVAEDIFQKEYRRIEIPYGPMSDGGAKVPESIVEALYAAVAFELSLLLVSKYQFPHRRHKPQFARSYREVAEWIYEDYMTVDDHHDAIADYYKSAIREIEEFGNVLSGCKPADPADAYGNRLSEYRVRIEHGNESYNRFCAFVDKQLRSKYSFVLKYLTIDTPPLSSGEQALQNIFSWLRLPPSFQEILGQDSVPIQDNVLLLLDEVDLYMHPEWQRKFLKLLSDELNAEYPNKHIQIVISTHSPLVLSDIPSGNIIYLEKNDEKCTIAPRPDVGESFGANIFTLLKDSFYLKRSLGEFAHARIEEVVRNLNALKKNPNDEKLRDTCRGYKQLIEIIGEPVIKRKLKNLYGDLFDTGPEDAHRRDLAELSRLLESGDPEEREKYRELLKKMLSEAKGS